MGGECFQGWISRQDDGSVRMSYGYTDVRIAEVIGLDTITDLPKQPLSLDNGAVTAMQNFKHHSGARKKVTTTEKVERRVQWVDSETNVTDDTPTEAEFFPHN